MDFKPKPFEYKNYVNENEGAIRVKLPDGSYKYIKDANSLPPSSQFKTYEEKDRRGNWKKKENYFEEGAGEYQNALNDYWENEVPRQKAEWEKQQQASKTPSAPATRTSARATTPAPVETKPVEAPKEEEKPVVKENLTTEEKSEETKVEENPVAEEKPVEEVKENPSEEKTSFLNKLKNLLPKKDKEQIEVKKSEQEYAWDEAMKNNPTFAKVLSDPKISKKRKLALIAEMFSTIASGAVRGAIGDTSEHKGLMQSVIEDAYKKGNERIQTQADAANKASIARDERLSWVNNSNILRNLPEEVKDAIADRLPDKRMNRAQFDKFVLGAYADKVKDKEAIYEEYKRLHRTNVEGMNIQKQSAELEAQNYATKAGKLAYESAIRDEIERLRQTKIDLIKAKPEERIKLFNEYLAGRRGLKSLSNVISEAENKTDASSGSIRASINAGLPGIGKAAIDGGAEGSRSRQSSNTSQDSINIDLASEFIPDAENFAKKFENDFDSVKKDVEKYIDKQIARLNDLLDESEMTKVDDAVIKADGQPTKIVKENGEEIEISPDDNIYVTKNEIETEKDNGESVIPLEQNDKVSIIQKNLGYEGGAINKNFNYYLDRLNALEV